MILQTGACAGEAVPPAIRRKFDTAIDLLDQASASPAKKAKRLRHRAGRLLVQAGHAAIKASHGRHAKLVRACVAALHTAIETLRNDLRPQASPR
jgi:hypothetical protein